MKKLIYWISYYYGISKSEANGFVILILLMITVMAGTFWHMSQKGEALVVDEAKLNRLIESIESNAVIDSINDQREYYHPLGQYKPRKKRDFGHTEDRNRVRTYEKKKLVRFDINTADTVQLKQLRGIGKVLSRRLVKYRDLLGGFVTMDQLDEVYGLQDSVLVQLDTMTFIDDDFKPRIINVNTSTVNDLSRHPYITRVVARAIYNYKFQHGEFATVEELDNVQLLDSLTLAKITPYISF